MKTHLFQVSGTHCASCKILIEDILNEQISIKKATVDLKNQTVLVTTELDNSSEELARMLTEKIKHNGYQLTAEKVMVKKNTNGLIWKALPIGLLVLAGFFILQKSGLLNIGFGQKITPLTSLFIGFIASISTCLAVVGGLVLSLSAKVAKDDKKNTVVFFLFHAGRIISFALLGGLLGLAGNAIGISFTFSASLGLLAAVVMITLGLNLTGLFKKNKIVLPAKFFSFFRKLEHKYFAPLLVGFGTFFLPCGFTQAMQIQALSSGSFFGGAGIMFFFALGTLPVLGLLSFTSVSLANSKHAPLFMKSAGIIVIGLGIFALLGGLAALGIITPLLNI